MPFSRRLFLYAAAGLGALSASAAFAAKADTEKFVLLGMAYVPPPYQAEVKFRTAEALDMVLAQSLAKAAGSPMKAVPTAPAKGRQLLSMGKLDAWIAPMPSSGTVDSQLVAIPTGYVARPMAIMRTDTTIKSAGDLRGRKICVAAGSPYVGMLAAKFGAVETVAKAPADSLLAIRTGACDAAVHDSTLLEELIKLPEWKKFSAALYLGSSVEQSVLIRRDDAKLAKAVKSTLSAWQQTGFINEEIKRMARQIAFEVYLDQDVPDCH